MLTEIQQVILVCLLGPEDKTAFKRARRSFVAIEWNRAHPEKARAKSRDWKTRNRDTVRENNKAFKALQNPEKVREQKRAWHKSHPLTAEERRCKQKAWANRNRERRNELNRLSKARVRARDPEKARKADREWQMKRRHEDLNFRLRSVLRSRICNALKRATKSAHTDELIGCTLVELRVHLERHFRSGMTWENYGPIWEIDHIRPCANFNLTDPAQQRICFNWSNLQPLLVEENSKKGASY